MSSKPFLIANYQIGVERDLEPWLLPDQAFPTLEDAYLYLGRIKRRNGFDDLGRIVTEVLAEAAGTVTTPWTSFSATLANPDISPGSITVTVGAITLTDSGVFGDQTGTLATSPVSGNTGTINYITGALTLTFSPALGGDTAVTVDYSYYPKNPVMGLRTFEETAINAETLIGFDTVKANEFFTSDNRFEDISYHTLPATNSFSWTGSNSDFFFTNNYANAFWVTNGTKGFQDTWNATVIGKGDGIRWFDASRWTNFLPKVNATDYLMGCLLIFSYRNRLVVLNTIEGTAFGASTQFRQRARWSQNGTPYPQHDPLGNVITNPGGVTGDDSAWLDTQVGKGGFIDAPTQEQIVGAEFFKDTLIVFFERSTWQLRYTGNEVLPFIWERIASEFGVESTFSTIIFEDGILGIGQTGLVYSDGTTTRRFDYIIPNEVFNIHNGNNGVKRVYGIRDYTNQLVYWTFPAAQDDPTFPNKVLVYNYLKGAREKIIEGSFSFFNDSITCFGYYQPQNDTTWASKPIPWESAGFLWNDPQNQSQFPFLCAGNQQGFVITTYNRSPTGNDYTLVITGATTATQCEITSASHNFQTGQIIEIFNINGVSLATVGEASGTALSGSTTFTGNLLNLPIEPSSVTITIGANVFTDDGIGGFSGGNGGSINYSTGFFTVNFDALGSDTAVTSDYTTSLNGNVFSVVNTGTDTFKIQIINENDELIFVDSSLLSAYSYGGRIVPKNNFNITTKRFNPFLQNGDQVRLQNCDYFVDAVDDLEFTTIVYLDENADSSVEQTMVMPQSDIFGKVWLRSYYSAIGQFAQLQIGFSLDQMFDPKKSNADFVLHAMMLWMSNGGRLTYGVFY